MLSFVGLIELILNHISMLQDPLMLAIHQDGDDGIDVGDWICADNKNFGDEPYHFNVVIS